MCFQKPTIRSYLEPVQSTTCCHALSKIHFNITLLSACVSEVVSYLGSFHKIFVLLIPHVCYMACPSHPLFNPPNNIL